jgi:hypothetical protein
MTGASSAADLEKHADVHRHRGEGEYDRQDKHPVSRFHCRLYPTFFWFDRAAGFSGARLLRRLRHGAAVTAARR